MKKEVWKLEEISADILSKDLSSHNMNMREKAEEALIKMGEASLDSMEKIIRDDSAFLLLHTGFFQIYYPEPYKQNPYRPVLKVLLFHIFCPGVILF